MYIRRPDQSLADGDDAVSKELRAYDKMRSMETQTTHRGKHFLRPMVDQFIVSNAGNTHHCLILRPMWGDVVRLEKKQPYFMLSNINLRSSIAYALKALDYMHSKCQLIHTGELACLKPRMMETTRVRTLTSLQILKLPTSCSQ